ncbi:MAG TPA: class I lanthipeptide [Thermoanaerobaculia bacterium]|nr:class I lanthipeptide [Thermoanaerobaculia bacterium]
MKKVQPKKLILSKETVARLEAGDLMKVGGGIWTMDTSICTSSTCLNEN